MPSTKKQRERAAFAEMLRDVLDGKHPVTITPSRLGGKWNFGGAEEVRADQLTRDYLRRKSGRKLTQGKREETYEEMMEAEYWKRVRAWNTEEGVDE